MPSPQTGILLLNIGSPSAPTAPAVRTYLDEFLSDPHVVDYPRLIWLPILRQIILRVRPPKSARLYASIWRDSGSPMIALSQSLAANLEEQLPDSVVRLGMRYGQPSIAHGLAEFKQLGVQHLILLPHFPQYSRTTTHTALQAARKLIRSSYPFERVSVVEDYHAHPAYIQALAANLHGAWQQQPPAEQLLLSYHGIPQRYTRAKRDPYYAQCLETSRLLAEELGRDPEQVHTNFQSRFGPEPWLQPYTDQTLAALGAQALPQLDVYCPGFAVDCLETLEEIQIRGMESYIEAGGQDFRYIPALNDSDEHVGLLATLIKEATQPFELN